jgi:hypothetical protein
MPAVRVEAQTSMKTYEVDLVEGKCTCSTPEQPCSHVLKARDIHADGCKRSRFEIVSALHKEIRRGDVETALYWADLLSKYSDDYVLNYVRRLVGEETRNWTLFMRALSPGASTYRDLVAAVASSRKKWEHPNGFRLFDEQMRAYNRETHAGRPWSEVLSRLTDAVAHDDVSKLYDAWTALDSGGVPEAIAAMDHVLIAAAEKRFPVIGGQPAAFLESYTQATKQDVWEARLSLVEMVAGSWNPSMNEFPYGDGLMPEFSDGRVLRRFPPYVYDRHVRQGARRIAEHREDIAPMTRLPEGIDLRWSGQIEGVAWRYAAFAQFGDCYRDVPWERVEMSAEYWDMACGFQAALEEGSDG